MTGSSEKSVGEFGCLWVRTGPLAIGSTPPEAPSGAPKRRSSPPLAGLARGMRPQPILVTIPRVGGGARRRDVNPRFPSGKEGPGTPLVRHRAHKVPTDSAEEAMLLASQRFGTCSETAMAISQSSVTLTPMLASLSG